MTAKEGTAMQTVALSENAVAVFRLRVKGLRMPPTERRLPAYRELVEAGIMEPVGEGFGQKPDDRIRVMLVDRDQKPEFFRRRGQIAAH